MTLLWLFDLVEEIDWPLFETFFILFSLFFSWWWWILALLARKDNLRYFQPCGYFSIIFMALDGSPSAPCIKKNPKMQFWRRNVFCAFENVIRGGLCPFLQILNLITGQDAWTSHIKSAPYRNFIRFCLRWCLSTDSQNDIFINVSLFVEEWQPNM